MGARLEPVQSELEFRAGVSLPGRPLRITLPSPPAVPASDRVTNESYCLVTALTAAPEATRSLIADIRHYFVRRPPIPTLVDFGAEDVREDYTHRIAQRVGIDVSQYSVLNIHRIGINAPVRYVFEEIVGWRGDSPYWPNHVATLEIEEGRPEDVRVVLLGRSIGSWLGSITGGRLGTLFEMHARTVRGVPAEADLDNARYILWDCSGGYPIGIFSVFARSPIAARDEVAPTQLFFAVGFNPYGRRFLSGIRPVRLTWEAIHNRVTTNVLNRFKLLCEAGFEATREGERLSQAVSARYGSGGADGSP